ncbi:wall-associated receptor kinase 2-like protein [Tanacetum coccineum]
MRSSCSLTFERRLNIATQTAEALAYILLTDDYTAKVSDFGISKFIPIDQTHVQTLVHGTLGYIDPEYFRSGILTEKSDVYSFGMFLVELLTGRKVFSHDGTESDLGLAIFFVSSLERGSLIHILDHPVKINGLSEHIKFVANLAKDCIELEGKKRPNMEEVKKKLKELRKSITDPGQLLLFYT